MKRTIIIAPTVRSADFYARQFGIDRTAHNEPKLLAFSRVEVTSAALRGIDSADIFVVVTDENHAHARLPHWLRRELWILDAVHDGVTVEVVGDSWP